MKILIESIPDSQMRYATLGDYFDRDGMLVIQVSEDCEKEMGTPHAMALVALHELVEYLLCQNDGVTNGQIDEFDLNFKGEGEPGDAPMAPYRSQHRFAMLIEHLVARELGAGSNYGKVE